MNGYESVENRWLKPGSLPPVAFMGTSGKWGFHGYEFVVLQCHKPPIGDGLLVKLGMLYDWHPIIAKLDRARCFSSAYPFVRSGRERKKYFFSIFPVFCGGKVCRNKKNTRAFGQRKKKRKKKRFFVREEKEKKRFFVRAQKEKKKKKRFFPFFAGKRYAETKKTRVRSGRERKKENFSIFPVFRAEKVCRNKKNTRAFGQRKKKSFFSTFPVFREEKVCRNKKKHACVRAEKDFFFFLIFPVFSRGKGMQKKSATHAFGQRNIFDFSCFSPGKGL